ncbi:GNAT family N-acetyltransferase [Microbacterium sp. STN6]|uniref:GNAT family N-acetyltransferase n=1 Tax=Microbacterium sp. STN6 TaxID=2995588 RepID=UPI002260A4ED|nr:GNAT family N-acetyltransferase [Microbacterium sp. STN6]MCX7522561.1 GNAT family N-acetyltransferase [Microbacterium sp. STN6]
MAFNDAPIDSESAERLRGHDLRLALVDTSDREAFAAWLQADARGFHGPRVTQSELDEQLHHNAYRRTTGVWDDTAPEPRTPVATVSSWTTPLSLPGGESLDAWAISSVTVSPTHRRRGIARALLESELRTAHACGIPLAILTVSEATIYSRYGFGPAAMAAALRLDTRKTGWAGPAASGRAHFVTPQHVHDELRGLMERARRAVPGEIELDDYLWARLCGLVGDPKDEAKHLRAVRYDDAGGEPQGFALYRVDGSDDDFTRHTASVQYVCAATDDAYAGLWRYLIELDLVGTVTAELQSVDEPVRWQVADMRAVHARPTDHLWARIIDVTAALEARRYAAPGTLAFDITDLLGFADGRILVDIDPDGLAHVSPLAGDAPVGVPSVALNVADLSSLYLGGVSASTLARAGRVTEMVPGSAAAIDASFRSSVPPRLSIWF